MKKILCLAYVMGCVLINSVLAKITYIDAELGNTSIGDGTPAEGVNYSTDYLTVAGKAYKGENESNSNNIQEVNRNGRRMLLIG